MGQGHIQGPAIPALKGRPRVGIGCRFEEIGCQQGSQQARHQQGEQHRDGDGKTKLLEKLAGETAHERDRQEHHDDRQRGRQHGQADLVGADHRRVVRVFTRLHPLLDILYLDDGVIHQDADDQGQREQSDHVEAEVHPVHCRKCGYQRDRHGQRGDHRGPPVAQEQEHHQRCQ